MSAFSKQRVGRKLFQNGLAAYILTVRELLTKSGAKFKEFATVERTRPRTPTGDFALARVEL